VSLKKSCSFSTCTQYMDTFYTRTESLTMSSIIYSSLLLCCDLEIGICCCCCFRIMNDKFHVTVSQFLSKAMRTQHEHSDVQLMFKRLSKCKVFKLREEWRKHAVLLCILRTVYCVLLLIVDNSLTFDCHVIVSKFSVMYKPGFHYPSWRSELTAVLTGARFH